MALIPFGLRASTNNLSSSLQQGLFEEEANRNLPAAIEAYESVANQFDRDRAMAATAIFRLGEVNRKLGNTNEAAGFYQRILREFSDQNTLVTLSRQNLTGMGQPTSPADPIAVGSNPGSQPTALDAGSLQEQADRIEVLLSTLKSADDTTRAALLQTAVRDPVIDQLKTQEITQRTRLVELSKDYTPQHIVYVNAVQNLEQTQALLLERQAAVIRCLEARHTALTNQLSRDFKQIRLVPVDGEKKPLDDEDQEIARIQAMIQNSPDLINVATGEDQLSPLCRAAQNGQLRAARFLLDHGAGINTQAGSRGKLYSDWTPILFAANSGHKAMVELLLARGADPNVSGRHEMRSRTPLHIATLRGFQAVVEALVDGGADVNLAETPSGETPLFAAVQRGDTGMVSYLISHGADAKAATKNGFTVLMQAATAGKAAIIDQLIQAGADIHSETLEDGRTALSYGADQGHVDAVTTLLEAGADPNAGRSQLPLHVAAKEGYDKMVVALLEAGADPKLNSTFPRSDPKNPGKTIDDKATALGFAVEANHEPVVAVLLQHGADPNDRVPSGNPAVVYAVYSTRPVILKSLLDAGANPNVQDHNGAYPLTGAANEGRIEAMKLLLAHGANPDAAGTWLPPLHAAIGNKHTEAVVALIKGGANVNLPLADGQTLLHLAVEAGIAEIVEALLEAGADPNVRNQSGLTPLELANQSNTDPRAAAMAASAARAQAIARAAHVPPPAPASTTSSNDVGLVTLLRQHGALDELPDWTSIRVTRQGVPQQIQIFKAHTNGWNRFTLIETLRNVYWSRLIQYRTASISTSIDPSTAFTFADFERLIIHRPSRTPGETGTMLSVNLLGGTNGINCDTDQWLEFGDVVEIPERVRALDEVTDTRLAGYGRALELCIQKRVRLIVRDESKDLELAAFAYLSGALNHGDARSLLRTSSDLSRVKVTRKDPQTSKAREFVLDVSTQPPESADLWLRDGDVIEVPEKE